MRIEAEIPSRLSYRFLMHQMYESSILSVLSSSHGPDVERPTKFPNVYVTTPLKLLNAVAASTSGTWTRTAILTLGLKFLRDNEIFTFAARSQAHFEAPLPNRSLSRKSPP